MRAECAELDVVDPNKEEQVILDGNKEASKYSFYMLGSFEVSPDHTKLAYAEDTTGGCLPEGLPALHL
jgi:oligopeptidase B